MAATDIPRRTLLAGGLGMAAGASLGVGRAAAAPATGPSGAGAPYPGNRAPLRQAAFVRLPPGSTTAGGWLATQLHKQLTGLNGRMPEISHFLDYDRTGWTNPSLDGWEEVPYWLRGFGDLGYVTGDATVKATTKRWIDGVLGTGQPDGWFGPSNLRTKLNGSPDFWPHMPMAQALRSFAEATGDGRIASFLTRFYAFMNQQGPGAFNQSWGSVRWADTLDVVYWLYNETGDAFLLDLVDKIHSNGANWVNNLPTLHNVNLAQGYREPALYAVRSGDDAMIQASYHNYDTVMAGYGQFPGGGFAGDENARPGYGDPRQGFETCGIVEFMGSHEIMTRITGDPVWADRCEELAFNLLPAALDPDGRTTHYVTSANSIGLDDTVKTLGQFDNGFALQAFKTGIDDYRCCPHNYGQGWPYFVEEMWLATVDGGLCASMYGPCSVTAKVAGGGTVTVAEKTDYPFSDTVTMTLTASSAATFPLVLRIPGWCARPELTVNGQAVSAPAGPSHATVRRAWSHGDTVTLRLPMSVEAHTWTANRNSLSVRYGPLTYSLPITERWTRTGGTADWPVWKVAAGSDTNAGLDADPANPSASLTPVSNPGGSTTDPFTPQNAPVGVRATVRPIDWPADSQDVVTMLPDGPVAPTGAARAVTLLPMGASRLRVTAFPRIGTGGTGGWIKIRNQHSGKLLAVSNMSMDDSAQVVQFGDNGTADHLWDLIPAGDGWVRIRNANSGRVLGVDGMSTVDSANVVQFGDNGTDDHLWMLVDAGGGWSKVRNRNSGKLLAVDGMSTADSARVVQFSDNGTADHLWQVVG